MGNCGTKPKTTEGPEPVPEPVTQQEVKVEPQENTPKSSDDKSLRTLLIEKKEEAPESEEEKAEAEVVKVEVEPKEQEPKPEEVKVHEEKPNTEEAKIEA